MTHIRFWRRRAATLWLIPCLLAFAVQATWAASPARPNFVVIFCDDLGYGDLGCYGHPTIRTPNIDRMAAEGMRMTQFYCAAPVCTPSRAALLTGRLPIRSGMCSNKRRVLFTDSKGGLPDDEVTIAASLKRKGYATACVGKWHLGHLPHYLPPQRGFDDFFGAPYSNDMKPFYLIRGGQEVERPVDQTTLTRRYTEAAVEFIRGHQETPFFLYLAHSFPHTPLHASADFKGRSPRGLFGDVVEELDWSTGQILKTLRELELAGRTMVVFTSDNGPWLIKKLDGGSAGLLRDGKGSTWEGGMRVPGIFWWPGKIGPGAVRRQVASTMDLFATLHRLAGVELPSGRTLDSHDLSPLLFADGASTRQSLFYYRGQRLMAVRHGPWKAHLFTQPAYGPGSRTATPHDPPLLYNLDEDPSEQYDVAQQHADVVEAIRAAIAVHLAGLKPAPSQLENP